MNAERARPRDPNDPCLFCTPRQVAARNALAYATRDSFAVSPGHTLVIPLRHRSDFFELTAEEMAQVVAAVLVIIPVGLAVERLGLDALERLTVGRWGMVQSGETPA